MSGAERSGVAPALVGLAVRWVRFVTSRPRLTFVVLALLTLLAGWISVDRYSMNSRLGDLVQQDAPWRADYEAFREAFPQLVETAVVVVRGDSFAGVERAALALEAAIAARSDLFRDVYAPANEAFFREHALLLLDETALDDVGDALAQAQPLLTAVAEDPTLRGVLGRVADAAANEPPAAFARIVERLHEAARSALAGHADPVPWADEFLARGAAAHYRLIFLRGVQNYGDTLPNARIVAELRALIDAQRLPAGVSVRLTGEVALRHEEVQAAVTGVQLAGGVALLLLLAVLTFGVRSPRIVGATFLLLLVGALWTSGLAMLTVGQYNTLSLVFLVMFFGLGVDFSVHFSLRVQEATAQHDNVADACAAAARSVGGAILLCSVTTAVGFLGFLPTAYRGLAELGVISAGGMLVACVLSFTLLPAWFAGVGLPVARPLGLAQSGGLVQALLRRRVPVVGLLLVVSVAAGALAQRMSFDYSVLALRDPQSESMRTLRELQANGEITDYALFVLAEDLTAPALGGLESLSTVDSVRTPLDLAPPDQAERRWVLDDLAQLLDSALWPARTAPAPQPGEERALLRPLARTLDAARPADAALAEAFSRLSAGLIELAGDDTALARFRAAVLDGLLPELDWLRAALAAEPFQFADLPPGLRARLVAPDGRFLVTVLPAGDISEVAELNAFLKDVRGLVPDATGRPVVEWGVGGIVVDAFRTALIVALSGITLILLLALRSLRDTLLVLVPLALTAVFTVATGVALGQPVNMASVLVLPLIFGLGVDNGIHMVERYHRERDNVVRFMHSSTPRAVLLSTLTTIGTFAALLLSPHQGTASIGFLLTVAVGYLLVFTLFLLPVLLSLALGHAQPSDGDQLA